jgi:CheY-like chemotaxis protein
MATNLKVAEGLLEPYGCRVVTCGSGEEAVELAGTGGFDLILMDHMMPVMDGMEATALIRAKGGRAVPVVALTANAVSGMRETFLRSGFNDFLPKPIDVIELNNILLKWLPQDLVAYNDNENHDIINHDNNDIDNSYKYKDDKDDTISIDGLDINIGLARVGGSIKNYKHILQVFYSDCIKYVVYLKTVPTNNNINDFTTAIHALKSASANVGAINISEKMKLLEDFGRNKDFESIKNNIKITLNELEKLINNLKYYLNINESIDDNDLKLNKDIIVNLIELKSAIENNELDRIDKIMDNIYNISDNSLLEKYLQNISEFLLFFDHDESIKLIDILIQTGE